MSEITHRVVRKDGTIVEVPRTMNRHLRRLIAKQQKNK